MGDMTTYSETTNASPLAQIISAEGAWEPPVAPDCMSQEWEHQWDRSSPQVRHNLTHAWLWYFDKHKQSIDTGWSQRLWNIKHQWIATLFAHVRKVMPDSPQKDACAAVFLRKILAKSKPGSPVIDMWFGDEREQRAALGVAGTSRTLEDLGDLKYVAEDLGWGIAIKSGRAEHINAAIHLSVLSGLSGLFHSDHYPASIPWHMLGQYCAGNLSSRPGLPFPMTVGDLRAFISSKNVKLVAPILGRLFQHSPSNASKALMGAKEYVDLEKDNVDDAAYKFLASWLPSHQNSFVACASLGLPFMAACDQIAETIIFAEGVGLPALDA